MKSTIIDRKNYINLVDGFFVKAPHWKQVETIIQDYDNEQKQAGKPTSFLFANHNKKTLGKKSEARIFETSKYNLCIDVTLEEDGSHRVSYFDFSSPLGHGAIHFRTNVRGYLQMLTLPVQAILRGWGDATKGFQHYVHEIETENSIDGISRMMYAGITKQGWQKRLSQHTAAAGAGSNRLFPVAIRNAFSDGNPKSFTTFIASVNSTYDDSMNWEEWFVDEVSLAPKGLNMIPGGFKGLKFLHEHSVNVPKNYSEKDIDEAVEHYQQKHPRAGYANPAISDLWKTDDYYAKAVCGREKCLNPEQVRAIRALNEVGYSAHRIAGTVNALNETQVQRVIDGKTYRRIL